jgi:hypothetical protein
VQVFVAVEILRYFDRKRNENYAEAFIRWLNCYFLANKIVKLSKFPAPAVTSRNTKQNINYLPSNPNKKLTPIKKSRLSQLLFAPLSITISR